MRIVHVTRSDVFAGTERYVAEVCRELALRGHDVSLVGGEPLRTAREAGAHVLWLPGATTAEATRSLASVGRADIVHAHLTAAEVAAVVTRRRHRGRVIATRHIAGPRGTGCKRFLAPLIARGIDVEIAISRTVDAALERPADIVILNGVQRQEADYDPGLRTVLVLQRLEPEKRTELALEAWRMSGLASKGWTLQVAGDGSQRALLIRQAHDLDAVELLGHVEAVEPLLRNAGIVLATADHEPLGLSVLEAMAMARPVLASRGGGHLETLPPDAPSFPVGNANLAAKALLALAQDAQGRLALGRALQLRQRECFSLDAHVEQLLAVYRS